MDMQTITQIVLAWELHEQGLNNTHIAPSRTQSRNYPTLVEEHPATRTFCLLRLISALDQHQKVAKEPRPARQVRVSTKQLIWAIRERERQCCGQKIAYFLGKNQITLSVPKIYELLSDDKIATGAGSSQLLQKELDTIWRGPPEA